MQEMVPDQTDPMIADRQPNRAGTLPAVSEATGQVPVLPAAASFNCGVSWTVGNTILFEKGDKHESRHD